VAAFFSLRKPEHRRITIPIPRPLPRADRDRHDTWCGMRWTRAARQTNAAHAYGQAVWSCPLDAGVKPADDESAGDGGYQARDTGESTEQPIKPLRRECRTVRRPVVTMLVCFFQFANEAAGAACTRHSLHPRFSGVATRIARTDLRRGEEDVCAFVIARS